MDDTIIELFALALGDAVFLDFLLELLHRLCDDLLRLPAGAEDPPRASDG